MGLNCKAGDIAVHIGKPGNEVCEMNQGRLFDVLYRAPDANGDPSWYVRPLGSAHTQERGIVRRAVGQCVDRLLRPIRPQSDDAVDTHSLRNPVPQQDEVTA